MTPIPKPTQMTNSTIKNKGCSQCGSAYHSAMYHKPRKPIETKTHCNTCGSDRHYALACPANRNFIKPKGKEATAWYAFKVQWMKDHDYAMPCHYCGAMLNPEVITLDHKIPRSRAPELRYELSNIVPCCFTCNGIKGSVDHDNYKHDCPDGKKENSMSDTTPTSLEAILLELSEASWATHMRKDLAVLQQEALAAIAALIPKKHTFTPNEDEDVPDVQTKCSYNAAIDQIHHNFKGRPEAGEGE